MRESMFNMLASLGCFEVEAELGANESAPGPRVVDLFAGSGALGIEALSRGASAAVFVDADGGATATISDNLRSLGWTGPSYRVVRSEAGRWAGGPGASDLAAADVVLADPPYAFDGWDELLCAIARSGFAGLAVLEAGREIDPGPGWNLVKARRYGTSVVQLVRPAVLAGLPVEPKGGV